MIPFEWLGLGIATLAGGISAWLMKVYKMGKYLDEPLEAPTSPVETKTPAPPSTTPTPNAPQTTISSPTERLYQTAVDSLGAHLTLNDTVPPEVGCAQAISKVLLKCGYDIPKKGISTVSGLTDWMLANGFKEEITYRRGLIITGRAPSWAHIGVTGNEWIMSNTSYTLASKGLIQGSFQANYQRKNWYGVFPIVRMFAPV